jgi:hypothetical protein
MQEACYADVFVECRPVDPFTPPDESPIPALLLGAMPESVRRSLASRLGLDAASITDPDMSPWMPTSSGDVNTPVRLGLIRAGPGTALRSGPRPAQYHPS